MKPKILSSEIAHKNPWYQIRHDRLEWSDGKPGDYYVAEFLGASLVIGIQDGKVLIVEQYRYPIDRRNIEFPNGGLKEGQTDREAAEAELLEETGYRADHFERLGSFFSLNGIAKNETHVFVATGLHVGNPDRESSEADMTSQWIDLDEWRRMIRENKIQDAETLSAWALYTEWISSHGNPALPK